MSPVNQDLSLNIQITRIITTLEIGRYVIETCFLIHLTCTSKYIIKYDSLIILLNIIYTYDPIDAILHLKTLIFQN